MTEDQVKDLIQWLTGYRYHIKWVGFIDIEYGNAQAYCNCQDTDILLPPTETLCIDTNRFEVITLERDQYWIDLRDQLREELYCYHGRCDKCGCRFLATSDIWPVFEWSAATYSWVEYDIHRKCIKIAGS